MSEKFFAGQVFHVRRPRNTDYESDRLVRVAERLCTSELCF